MSRGRTIILLALLYGLGAVGLAEAQPGSGIVRPTTEPSTPSVELGAELYAGNCASCHGIAGSGISSPRQGAGDILGAGPPLRGVGARAADFYLRTGYMPLSSIRNQPGRYRVLLSDKEVRSLVGYVASLGSGAPDSAPGSLRQQHLGGPSPVHVALRRLSPGGRARWFRDRRARAAAAERDADRDRRGGQDRSLPDAALLEQAALRCAAGLDHRLRALEQASSEPRWLGDRQISGRSPRGA